LHGLTSAGKGSNGPRRLRVHDFRVEAASSSLLRHCSGP
jgi:hypothetical protein